MRKASSVDWPNGTQSLSANWELSTAPDGRRELRASQKGRGCVGIAAGLVALSWIGWSLSTRLAGHSLPLGATPLLAVLIAMFAGGFAVWVGLANEVWLLQPNQIEHRLGIGRLSRASSYSDGTIGVLMHFNQWGTPFGRVYVVTSGGRHLLFLLNANDAVSMADLLCAITEWSRQDFPLGTGY